MPVFSCVESACIEDLSGVQTLHILKDCFKYETANRARAIDIVNAFS